jgi:hypothetical protein
VCHDVRTKSHKDWFSHSEVDKGDTQTHRQHGDCISVVLFFKNKESRLILSRMLKWALVEHRTSSITCRKSARFKNKIVSIGRVAMKSITG